MIENLRMNAALCLICGLAAAVSAQPAIAETGPPDLAKELWIEPAHNTAGAVGDWGTTTRGLARFSFGVPADFGSFTSAKILVIGKRYGWINYDLSLSISSDGMHHNTFTNDLSGGPLRARRGRLLEIDVSDVFDFSFSVPPDTLDFPEDLLRGEDAIGLRFSTLPRGTVRVVGLRFQYDQVPALGDLSCPENQVVFGFDDEGSLICAPGCEIGDVLVGWGVDADGAPVPRCIPDHQTCGADEVMVGFDLDGLPICRPDNQACGPDEVMVGIDLSGRPLCKPDNQACAGDEVMVGFDLDGLPICRSDAVACGKECFGGSNDGASCESDAECLGSGSCEQALLVGFDLRGNLDCRTIGGLQVGAPTAIISIQDLVAGTEGTDGTTPFTLTVSREPVLTGAETDTVDFATQDLEAVGGASCGPGIDYISQAGSLTFVAADCSGPECSKDVTVLVCADSDPEDDERFQVVLSLPAGSSSEIANDTGQGLIRDDDTGAPATATLTVVISPSDGGGVSGPGVSCPDDCQEIYFVGEAIELFVRPRFGFSFVGWSGDDECDGAAAEVLPIVMDADKTCTANFQ